MRWSVVAALLAAWAPGQDRELRQRLERAVVIEEHDPARAVVAYREVVSAASGDLRAEASLRLGAALVAIGKRDEAKAAVADLLAGGGELAARAHAVIDGQDQADKFLVKRFEAAVEALKHRNPQELLFLGMPAVPLIVRRLRTDFASGAADQAFSGGLLLSLCMLGGKASGEYLSELAASSDLFARRVVADAVRRTDDVPQFDGEVMGALERFTRDAEPSIRAQVTWAIGARLSTKRCAELASDPDASVRRAAFERLSLHIQVIAAGSPCPEPILAALRNGCDETDETVRGAIRNCLAQAALLQTAAGRKLVIAAIAHPSFGFAMPTHKVSCDAPNQHADDLAAAARAMAARGERLDRLQHILGQVFTSGTWNSDAWPQVLTLLEAGYSEAGQWLAARVGTDSARAVQLVERLGKFAPGQVPHVLSALRQLELPKEAFAPLEAWQEEPPQRGKTLLMTAVDDDRAAAWLLAAAGKTVPVREVVLALDPSGSAGKRQPNARRDAVLVELAFHPDLDWNTQQAVFGLCERGNEKAIAQIGRAYELNIRVLAGKWERFPEAALARMVDLALATGNESAFEDVTTQLRAAGQNRTTLPAGLIDAVLQRTPECLLPASSSRVGSMARMLSFPRITHITDAQWRDLSVRIARRPEALDVLVDALGSVGSFRLPAEVLPALLGRLGEAGGLMRVSGGRSLVADYVSAVSQVDGPTVPQVLRDLLKHPAELVRATAVPLVARLGDSAAADLVPMFDDPSPQVRWAMIEAANLVPDPRFVPGLLSLMRTQIGERDKIQKVIELIDFQANQTARWKRILEGGGLDSPSAAEALVKQAKPGNDPAVRLAAIASLGTLKVPETLPVLVELLRETDPAIQAAAQAAITKINGGR